MSLAFEYGINTGNRFGQLLDHDEDPDEFIANQIQSEEKTKKSKDAKSSSASTKKSTTKSTTSATTTASTTATGATAKSNKENVTGKTSGNEQRKQQNVAFSDNQQQSSGRPESGRGSGRGGSYPRRGGSAGPDRGGRGSGNPRFNRYEGQQTGGFEQGPDAWTGESGNDNQQYSGSRGRGRGRGNYEGGRGRGNYEGGRGRGNYEGGRGFGRGGRGRGFNNANRQHTDSSQGQEQETSNWEQSTTSNFDSRAQNTAADSEIPISPQGQTFDTDQPAGRGGRGQFRSRTFRSNRNQGEHSHHHERGEHDQQGGQDEYRQNRRAHDRQPRNNVSSVKPIEKKDGQGAHNWGNQTEVPEEEPVVADETAEGTAAPATGSTSKDWSQRVDEEEQRLITFDEYKKQIEEKKKLTQEKLPQFKRRTAGEGEDPKAWKEPQQVYRKKDEDEASDEEEEGEAEVEEGGSEDETDEPSVGKKKVIQIPLFFKPIETPRGGSSGRGGRRGGGRPPGERSAPRDRDEQGQAPQQQTAPSSQPTGDEERPQSGYRGGRGAGGSRGAGRGEYRRSYGNAARGSRGGYYSSAGKSGDSTSKFDFGNTDEFPTLAKKD